MANKTICALTYGDTHVFTLPYGTCSTAAGTAAKTVSVQDGKFSLETGARVCVKFTVNNTVASPTLNVSGTGAKNIFYRGAAIPTGYLAAKRIYEFIYDGTNWELLGDVDTNTDTTTTTSSTNTDRKIFLIGATTQGSGKTTYSHDTAYVGTDGCLYSNNTKVSVNGHTHTPEDIGARPDTWIPTASDVGGITFKGSNRTEIAAGSDLNNIITLGNYVCSGANTAQGLSNCPTATAFRMEVVAVTGGSDVLNVNSWTYIEQRIQDLNGYEYKRFIHTNNDGVIHYGHGWITAINSNNIGSQSVNYANSANSANWSNGAHVASNTDPGSATLKNISAGTNDIGAGAGLATGQLYFVYE